ncbi:MAG TPA: saccharopine dehydrogenase NADP-binding domain-containing protein [Leptospiraceae bacterium]|nr:saccharopine dehydrogenase NADP-binding domain-containing protein [Leptospiraceae bacterium]HNF15117.1 saccharopine dehydrogenase NADP-binding domain-containing protein [Leptospiraceae bacterium]HNF26324.1 saccharopine dehydrogenase NADP-binding domain-containing protein [Leptospiraceae bacterium]HNI97769.1 saccharopine dehydrogenase NADP-binding domain-containing protein [Leptospiraceae bacterium]HNN05248.1 saccharopine dehydrogenase NADP-binding domain-containing protein [Leptospiraceae ba
MTEKEFDIVVYGATGFTGRLVAEYLTLRGFKGWAMAGRSETKLQEIRDEVGVSKDIPLIVADASNPDSLNALCEKAKIVLTTVGPYQLYGSELVAVCANTGTDYLDLNGEPAWARQMIDEHEAAAKKSGARIVLSAGFDSVPSDLGVWFLQQEAVKKFGKPVPRVKGRVREMRGGPSGGSMATMKATLKASIKNPAVVGLLANAFALTPGFEGPSQPSGLIPEFDKEFNVWAAPFVMAGVNTKNVHRTNFLLNHPYGKDFVYDEMMLTTLGEAASALVDAAAKANPFVGKGLKPGDGPTKEERENGMYDFTFTGEYPDGERIRVSVKGDRDPGYGSTSKIISEAALTLLEIKSPGGMYTPGGLMAAPLQERLQKYAGVSFAVEPCAQR